VARKAAGRNARPVWKTNLLDVGKARVDSECLSQLPRPFIADRVAPEAVDVEI
jgi:hypothetical protein